MEELVQMELLDYQERGAQRDCLDPKVHQDQTDKMEPMVREDHADPLERQEHLEHQGSQVRNRYVVNLLNFCVTVKMFVPGLIICENKCCAVQPRVAKLVHQSFR